MFLYFTMTRPSRNPDRYSNSTIWFHCPICSKPCKSKASRLRHIRAKHDTTILDELEDVANVADRLPQTPSQNSNEFEGISTPDPINTNFAISPEQFGM